MELDQMKYAEECNTQQLGMLGSLQFQSYLFQEPHWTALVKSVTAGSIFLGFF